MGGLIDDATLVAAPKQLNTTADKEAIKAGRTAAEIWPDEPAKLAQKRPNQALNWQKQRLISSQPPKMVQNASLMKAPKCRKTLERTRHIA
jgi:hypothetical protein